MQLRISLATLAIVLCVTAATACTTAQGPAPSLTKADAPQGCPLGVAGATVVAEDTPEGVSLSFTSKDRPAEMRERANDAAAQHGSGEHLGVGHEGHHGQGGDHGLQMMQGPLARSASDDIENGARIRFQPVDPAEIERLRARIRERADAMNGQVCH